MPVGSSLSDDGSVEVIGEAYVYGIADGEAFDVTKFVEFTVS